MKSIRNLSGFVLLLLFAASQSTCNSYVTQGEALYDFYCESCHMKDGSGLEGLIPPLTDEQFLNANRDLLPCILKYGIKDPLVVNGITYTDPMEGFKDLTETEITNILNYVGRSWGNNISFYQPEEVRSSLINCSK